MSNLVQNRIKVVFAEKNLSSKWLAEQLNKNEEIICSWYTNEEQLPIKTIVQISELLEVKLTNLFNE